ncbi:Uncharacterised protein [Mycobacteroides abscessus]|nr:Uncharacterised protein [Mycobacteroides abscessus]
MRHDAGAATPTPVPCGWSFQNSICEPATRTGWSHVYWTHCWAGLLPVHVPHMSGGRGLGRTISSLSAFFQYCVGTGSLETVTVASCATFARGVVSRTFSGVVTTCFIRGGDCVSSHSTRSIATERRKWLPPSASAVWYAIHHSPSNSRMPGWLVVEDTGARTVPRYVHGPSGDDAVPYAMHAW